MKLFIAIVATVMVATLMIQFSSAEQLTCKLRGGVNATRSVIETYCPQWNNTDSCCDQEAIKTYFETERQICNRKFNMADGKCEKELRGWLCFSLCAPDQVVKNYTNLQGQLKICDNYAHDTFEQCRGKLHCPMTTPDGKNNTQAKCHTDNASTEGCFSIGQAYHDQILFVEDEITGFIGVDLKGNDVGKKPEQEYVFNVDVKDDNMHTCFAGAASTSYAVATLVIMAVVAIITV